MREFRERNMWRAIVYSRVTLFLVLCLTVFMINIVFHAYVRERSSFVDSQKVEARVQEVQDHTAELKATVASLQTSQGVEREIRNKFNVVKTGEEVVLVVGPDATSTATTTKKMTILDQIKDLFR